MEMDRMDFIVVLRILQIYLLTLGKLKMLIYEKKSFKNKN
jgi:hypothetical protein